MNTLGFDKRPCDTKIVVAMSGGVDSSVTAAILAAEGYDVIGVTLQLFDHLSAGVAKVKACCAGRDIRDAEAVAAKIGIRHYTLNYKKLFMENVIADFANSYIRGETPIPCIKCNEIVKFKGLLEWALEWGADAIVTGHYVKWMVGKLGPELHRAADAVRDQSYFLFTITRDQLKYLRFPLGGMQSKVETRSLAAEFGFDVASKPDSQDICFIADGGYAEMVNRFCPGATVPGEIVDSSGTVLGRHDGIIHYTVGQRKRLNFKRANGEIFYVTKIDAERNLIVVGLKHHSLCRIIHIRDVNWIADRDLDNYRVEVKTRSTQAPVPGILYSNNGIYVILDVPQFGIAPGQACVFYEETRMLGGGWIVAASP